jgi:hypothetical protein
MRSFNDAVTDGTNVRSVEKRTARLGNAFFGDSGTQIPETTRDEIEKNAGAGHPGNTVDYSQRTAPSEVDEHTERAERMTRDMERGGVRLGAARDKFVADMADHFRGGPIRPAKPQDPEEKPFSNEEFFNNPEELKKAARAVRPPKL